MALSPKVKFDRAFTLYNEAGRVTEAFDFHINFDDENLIEDAYKLADAGKIKKAEELAKQGLRKHPHFSKIKPNLKKLEKDKSYRNEEQNKKNFTDEVFRYAYTLL